MTYIPFPQRTSDQKLKGEFYPLQKQELIALKQAKLINNTAYVHFALRFENPFCDRPMEVIPKEFALRWAIPESSVYEAIAKLKELGAVRLKSGKMVIEWAYSQQGDVSGNPEKFWNPRKNSDIPEKILTSQKNLRDLRKNSGISENRASKQPPEAASGSPQISQTYSDFKQTLSDSEKREFLDFVRKQTKNFPQPINDLEAWLASKSKAGENRWEVYYRNFLSQQQPKEKAPKRRRLHEELEQRKRELEQPEMEQLASGESKVREITAPAG